MKITVSVRNDNPNTIWNRLAMRLGRVPTSSEARAEVERILANREEATTEAITKDKTHGQSRHHHLGG